MISWYLDTHVRYRTAPTLATRFDWSNYSLAEVESYVYWNSTSKGNKHQRNKKPKELATQFDWSISMVRTRSLKWNTTYTITVPSILAKPEARWCFKPWKVTWFIHFYCFSCRTCTGGLNKGFRQLMYVVTDVIIVSVYQYPLWCWSPYPYVTRHRQR